MFVENAMTAEKLLLQLVDSSLLFEFSDVTVTYTVRSIPVQAGIWYRVLATR